VLNSSQYSMHPSFILFVVLNFPSSVAFYQEIVYQYVKTWFDLNVAKQKI
jgi:hypothetical protein